MAQIINLRRFRKARARDDAADEAAANRITFGQSKSGRALVDAQTQLETRRLDGKKLEGKELDRDGAAPASGPDRKPRPETKPRPKTT